MHYQRLDLDQGKLPFPDASFDTVIFTHVLEHLQRPLDLGPEISRVLKPGGRLYIETPNWTSLLIPSYRFRHKQQGPFNFYDDPTHLKPWSIHGIHNFVFQACGLRVEKSGAVVNIPRLFFDPLIMLMGLLLGRRDYITSSVWNLTRWAIFAIGRKD